MTGSYGTKVVSSDRKTIDWELQRRQKSKLAHSAASDYVSYNSTKRNWHWLIALIRAAFKPCPFNKKKGSRDMTDIQTELKTHRIPVKIGASRAIFDTSREFNALL